MQETALEQRILLNPCTWETYERLLAEHADRSQPRFTYREGVLEIMSPSPEHEELNETIKQIVYVACEELDIELRPLGSATQRRPEVQQGVEPDSSFYFQDVRRDPALCAPDLMVEIEICRSALDKLPTFARLGVPEVWRCRPQGVTILSLQGSEYHPRDRSSFLPLTADGLTHQVSRRVQVSRKEWLSGLRQWVRDSATPQE